MRCKRSIAFLGLILFLSLVGQPRIAVAQEDKKIYTMEQSIADALASNWTYKAKKEKIDQANYSKKQARAEFLPKLSTTYGYNRQSDAPFVSLGGDQMVVGTQDNYEWRGIVHQPLFTGFALISAFELAKLGINQSEIELELAKLDLILRVKEAYFGVLIADKALEVAHKEVEFLQSNLKVTKSFYQVGMIPINDLLEAEVELANSQQTLVRAENASWVARSTFNTVLSRPISEAVEVEDILNYKPEQGDFKEYVGKALLQRPEIKAIDVNLLQADQQIRLAKSKNYPEVSLEYDYIKAGDSPDVSGSPYHDANRWEVMTVLNWTFWEWGKTHYSSKEQESRKDELLETRKALEDDISLEVKRALLDLEEAEKNIPTTRKAVDQAEENLRVNEERYKAQVTTITEVIDAQARLSRARVNYYRALYGHNLARARLERALGTY